MHGSIECEHGDRREMDTYAIVRPEHLNHHGTLFGGQLLKWVDENAWLVASLEYPDRSLVTRAMDRIDFKTSVPSGSILRFCIRQDCAGSSSVTYAVDVYAHESPVFSTSVTFVCVDAQGHKQPLGGTT